jgi:hypothetical protein
MVPQQWMPMNPQPWRSDHCVITFIKSISILQRAAAGLWLQQHAVMKKENQENHPLRRADLLAEPAAFRQKHHNKPPREVLWRRASALGLVGASRQG